MIYSAYDDNLSTELVDNLSENGAAEMIFLIAFQLESSSLMEYLVMP